MTTVQTPEVQQSVEECPEWCIADATDDEGRDMHEAEEAHLTVRGTFPGQWASVQASLPHGGGRPVVSLSLRDDARTDPLGMVWLDLTPAQTAEYAGMILSALGRVVSR